MNIHILVNDGNDDITDYQSAIKCAGNALLVNEDIYQDYIQACIDREQNFPTGLLLGNGVGIAIPHANAELVRNSSISIVRLKNSVAFGLMEDASLSVDCRLVFNLALASGEQHITILRKLVRAFQNDSFITNCSSMSKEELVKMVYELLQNA
ncbi:PTS sugar transporter subunit IIA [Orbus mooreae]|uniref:PTS sugar transporter subunit IIA n=1 Tax=Orbus mooreae TaxID=3074107 RepID=UPI00370DC09B